MTNNAPKKVPFHQKIKFSVLGAVASIAFVLIPAYALVAVVDPGSMTIFQTQFGKQLAEFANQARNQAEQITIAKAEQVLMERLQKEANTLSASVTNKLNSAVNEKLNSLGNGALGKVLSNSGLSLPSVAGPNVIGHVDPAATQSQLAQIGATDNVKDVLAVQAQIALTNQLNDRLNVTSMLDEKPTTGTCSPGVTNCTILTLLREYDAIAMTDLQKVNVGAVNYQVAQKGTWDQAVLSKMYEMTGTKTFDVLAFLTPAHTIPLGFDRNPVTAANLEKSMWLSQVMVGAKNDAQFLAKEAQQKEGGDSAGQLDAMAKIAKVQLARGAIMNVHNENLHLAFNAQFRACVVRPDAQDRVGATQEQQLVHIQSLLRCSNMIQLQQRQQELETQRLLGTMLLTLLDLYAVQEPGKR